MPPLFVVQEILDCDILEEMKIYKEKTGRKTVTRTKKLLVVMKAERILLYTPVIEWHLQHGLRLTAVRQLIEYEPGMSFSCFPEEAANARCEADKDPLKKQLDDVTKLKENSFYGKNDRRLGSPEKDKIYTRRKVH